MRSSSISMVFCCPVAGLAKHNFMLRGEEEGSEGGGSALEGESGWSCLVVPLCPPRSSSHSLVQPLLVHPVPFIPVPERCASACAGAAPKFCGRAGGVVSSHARVLAVCVGVSGGVECREQCARMRSSRGRLSGRGEQPQLAREPWLKGRAVVMS